MSMSPAERKLRNARSVVVHGHAFYGNLLLRQKVIEVTDGSCPTCATDGDRLYFNPDWVLAKSAPELHFTCAHEALHPGLLHHLRRGDRDFEVWNEACDYAINPILVRAGFTPPPKILLRADFAGMGAEQIYVKLMDERRARSKRPDGSGERSNGGSAAPTEGGGAGAPNPGGSPAGSEGGQARRPQRRDFGDTGCVLDGAKDEAEKAAKAAEWKIAVQQAAAVAGGMPGEVALAAEAVLAPRADWRDLLRRFMDQFGRADYSWRFPNRRFIAGGTYLPSLRSESLPPIAFVIDASASMPSKSLDQAVSEVESIVSQLLPERLDVVVHDARVCGTVSFEPNEPVAVEVQAGGGTRFLPVCEWLAEQPGYACVIWFTDMDPVDWPAAAEKAPDCPVLWVDYGDTKIPPQFGDEVIRMPREAA